MPKNILIVGGGISGLAVLHYLKKKYTGRPDVEILLLEKNAAAGGTVHSVVRNGCLFEAGPNGFLDSKPRTLEFARELGLEPSIVRANDAAKIRYIALKDKLHALPENPQSFLKFAPLSPLDKLRVFGEIFVPKGNDTDESVYDFGARRFGKRFADIFLDPMVSGIYGGDARQTVLKAAFGRIYELEQQYGSLFKAMMKLRKGGIPKGTLTSFRRGQAQLTDALACRYKNNIRFNHEVKSIVRASGRFTVATAAACYEADELFVCTPAYQAAAMMKEMSPLMAQELENIRYSPMAVVGLVFPRKAFVHVPEGFGYLIPSSEGKPVLGVLWESNIFPDRCRQDHILMRIMLGGSRHPGILSKSRDEIIALALAEVRSTLKLSPDTAPAETFYVQWPKAIPQYDRAYCDAETKIAEELKRRTGLYLVANYRNGVSLNDCIENAYQAAQCSNL